jgi:hypothetical protein
VVPRVPKVAAGPTKGRCLQCALRSAARAHQDCEGSANSSSGCFATRAFRESWRAARRTRCGQVWKRIERWQVARGPPQLMPCSGRPGCSSHRASFRAVARSPPIDASNERLGDHELGSGLRAIVGVGAAAVMQTARTMSARARGASPDAEGLFIEDAGASEGPAQAMAARSCRRDDFSEGWRSLLTGSASLSV